MCACGMRLLYLSMVVLLVVTVLQMSHVGAIREFSVAKVKFSNVDKKDLLHKYFSSAKTFDVSNTIQKGFDENKRRVPSCPDPLHN
ncbi:hypothetical protein Lal_00030954 [Lupinus albus]|uniref:Uncharacterized protein n=1 Tax=Lupinus albus TaxID=3870 RepID=A0A6A4NZP3_LUPAL|nr:hypothetical protein Lalb_Chr17g0342121 [Lupinus albus]KAF1863838.1 hypothetical protein Lal_00030954 [Lupinus albus]